MIYKQKKVIFLHIYKIAGKSIKNSLIENQDKNLLVNKIYNNTFGYLGYKKKYLPHQSIEIERNGELLHSHIRADDYRNYLGDKFDDYFTFTFVRNPFDWQVSLYQFMREKKSHPQHSLMLSMNFKDYIKWRCTEEPEHQTFFILDDKEQNLVNFIGKFESLEKDLKKVCDINGLKMKQLEHLGSSNRKDYREYYDSESQKLLVDTFKKDFEFLNYSTDL